MSLACVGSTRSILATLAFPPLTACVLFPSTLLRFQAALQVVGPGLHALPGPKSLKFRFSGTPQRHRLGWACVLCFLQQGSSGSQKLDQRTRPRCRAPYPLRGPSLSFQLVHQSLCLFCGADLWLRPSQRMSTIQNLRKSLVRNWRPICSLVGGAISGADAPSPSSLPPAGGGWAGPQLASSSMVFIQSFVQGTGGYCLSLGLSPGYFSLSCYPTV